MNFRGWVAGLALAGFAAACAAADRADDPMDEDAGAPVAIDPTPTAASPPDTLATLAETVHIEGMPEVLPSRVFQSPDDFPLGFSTIVPADMEIELVRSAERDGVRFQARFGGVRSPAASLTFVALPEGASAEAARTVAADLASQVGGVRASDGQRYDWAVEEYRLEGGRSGFLALGEHRGVWFYILSAYPPEFGDGMGPRVALILRRWTWSDGTALLAG